MSRSSTRRQALRAESRSSAAPSSAAGSATLEPAVAQAYATVALELQRVRDAVRATGTGDAREVMDLPVVSRALEEGGPELRALLAHTILGIDERAAAKAQALGLPAPDVIPAAVALRPYGVHSSFLPDATYAAAGGGKVMRPTGQTGSSQQASGGNALGGGWMGQGNRDVPQGVPNAATLRMWADQVEWVRAAIKARKDRIGGADILTLPSDTTKKLTRAQKDVQTRVDLMLQQPNPERQNWLEFAGSLVEDLLTLDRGCIEKGMNLKREPQQLWVQDGACIKIYPAWDGDPKAPRYLYEESGTSRKVPLRNDELICMMANAASYRFSLSPVQVLRNTILADIAAMQSGADLVNHKPPPHLVQFPKASQMALDNLRTRYETEQAGKREIWLVGGDEPVKVQSLMFSLKDNQWLEWQEYLARKICAVFQISPQTIGLTFDINRATAESQERISEDLGLIPLMLLIEAYLNRELLADFAPAFPDGRTNLDALNLRIMFPQVSEAARMLHAEQTIALAKDALAGAPVSTLNYWLAVMGEEPVAGGDTFWVMTPTGPVPWLSYDGETGAFGEWSAVGPQLGGQDALGGPSLSERDMDTPGKGPAAAAASGGTGADGGAAGGNPGNPNAQTSGDDGTPGFGGDDGPAAAATKALRSPATRKRATQLDTRRPGKHWRPPEVTALPPPVPPSVRRAADMVPVPASAAAPATLPAGRLAWQTLGRLAATRAAAADLDKAAGNGATSHDHRPHPHSHPLHGHEDHVDDEGKPVSLGRVPAARSATYQTPQGIRDARTTLREQVGGDFVSVAHRGRRALLGGESAKSRPQPSAEKE